MSASRPPRAALITGGSLGAGLVLATALADAGYAVAIQHDGDVARAEAALVGFRAAGVACVALQAALARPSGLAALVDQAASAIGPLEVLVNAAWAVAQDSCDAGSEAIWDRMLDANLRAPRILMRRFAACLPENASGLVVNLIDRAALAASAPFLSYSIAQAGLLALTRATALAWAPRIRVNAIGVRGPAGTDPDLAPELARGLRLLLALPSMTGEVLALDDRAEPPWRSRAMPAAAG
jgi:NAD(P)-dependent dehydrogenase (short-subunit alcohol dehydrogenase family)